MRAVQTMTLSFALNVPVSCIDVDNKRVLVYAQIRTYCSTAVARGSFFCPQRIDEPCTDLLRNPWYTCDILLGGAQLSESQDFSCSFISS